MKLFVEGATMTSPATAGDTENSPPASPVGGNAHVVAPLAELIEYTRRPTPTITLSPTITGCERGATVVLPNHLHAKGRGPSTALAVVISAARQVVVIMVLESIVFAPMEPESEYTDPCQF
jgi:hypothetical protein